MVATSASIQTKSRDTQTRILIAASDAESTHEDSLDQDAREIRASLSDMRTSDFTINTIATLDRDQFVASVKKNMPNVVIFSGRGSTQQFIRMSDSKNWIRQLSGATLSNLFADAKCKISLLLLLNCGIYRETKYVSEFSQYLLSIRSEWQSYELPINFGSQLVSSFGGRFDSPSSYVDVFERFSTIWDAERFKFQLLGPEELPNMQALGRQNFETWSSLAARTELTSIGRAHDSARHEAKDEMGSIGEPDGPRIYRVWFGTNRKQEMRGRIVRYGSERDDKITYGHCDVSIPKYHTIGSVGEPWWRRFPRFWQNNRLAIQEMHDLESAIYFAELKRLFEELPSDEKVLLVFLHGYNVSFEDAAIRAAQIGVDLGIPGATAFFSWPSKGQLGLRAYMADEATIQASEKHISTFIEKMCEFSGADVVHIIAHSMGNRGLLRTFDAMTKRIRGRVKNRLNQVILAAPDVDCELFKDLAEIYESISKRTTMYISSKDLALNSSGLIHAYPRAGYTPPVTVVDGIDTVEASNIDLTFLGHGYVAEARPVLGDMHTLMKSNDPPNSRFGLELANTSTNEDYWVIRA